MKKGTIRRKGRGREVVGVNCQDLTPYPFLGAGDLSINRPPTSRLVLCRRFGYMSYKEGPW